MKNVFISTVFALFCFTAFAGNPPNNYPAVSGVVKKIDLSNKVITLKHEAIPNLSMPGMTMPFIFSDANVLSGIQVGDKVRFAADQNADGDLLLIWIEKSQPSPPNNYPAVNGVIKKIDLPNKQITLKHDAIPNLNMPGMTMTFLVQDLQMISGLNVGDSVLFSADQNNDGDLILIWITKAQQSPITNATPVLCTGIANTSPKTNIEIEIFQDKPSTIRYEYAEGSLKGTSYTSALGDMVLQRTNDHFLYKDGDAFFRSQLSFQKVGTQIQNAKFSSYSANMNLEPVQCSFKN